jgi:hypothetical protein
VAPLGIVEDSVAGLHPNPLVNGTILLHLLGENPLEGENLLEKAIFCGQIFLTSKIQ